MRRLRILPLLLAVAIGGPAAASPALPGGLDKKVAPETFRYRFTAGETLSYRDRVVQIVKTGPDSVKTTLASTQDVTTTQVAPGGGHAKLESRRNKVAIAIEEGDSAMPTAKLQPVVAALEKVRLSARVSPRGLQSSVNVEHVSASVKQLLDSFGQAMVGATPVFAEEAVAVGDSWTQTRPFEVQQGPARIRMNFEVTYSYEGRVERAGRQLAVVSSRTALTVVDSKLSLGDATLAISGSGTGDGVLLFDLKRGRISRAELQSTQRLTLEVSGGAEQPKMEIFMRSQASRQLASAH